MKPANNKIVALFGAVNQEDIRLHIVLPQYFRPANKKELPNPEGPYCLQFHIPEIFHGICPVPTTASSLTTATA